MVLQRRHRYIQNEEPSPAWDDLWRIDAVLVADSRPWLLRDAAGGLLSPASWAATPPTSHTDFNAMKNEEVRMPASDGRFFAALAIAAVVASPAWAQGRRSVDPAAALTSLMDAGSLQAFAAVDPAEEGRFVAALYFPGTQLLVVSAKYPAPPLLLEQMAAGHFQQTYSDLQSGSEQQSKWFFQDLLANGLNPERQGDEPFDMVYRSGQNYIRLDGDWKRQRLAESEYRSRYAAADERYAHDLQILVDALRKKG
jgi:hypothetical protein